MARTKKTAVADTEAAQNARENQEVSQDVQNQDTAQETAEAAREGAVTQEIVGPDNPEDLLGCQDADEAELEEGLLVEYAVTAKGGLRLRESPALDAPVVAVLPWGAGVLSNGDPEDGWLYVLTGRLEGWMMARHLEALSVAAYGAE